VDLVDHHHVVRSIRLSCSQRRAIPVVTMTTFQVGRLGRGSRSRLTTPTRRSGPTTASAMGRMASVFPVPVPDDPKPSTSRRQPAESAPCSRPFMSRAR
jgi:hypothetical protein